jgi:hypothetical protein
MDFHAHDKSRLATPSWCMLAEPTRLVKPKPSHAPCACATIVLDDSCIVGVETIGSLVDGFTAGPWTSRLARERVMRYGRGV